MAASFYIATMETLVLCTETGILKFVCLKFVCHSYFGKMQTLDHFWFQLGSKRKKKKRTLDKRPGIPPNTLIPEKPISPTGCMAA